jgi:hypothetical protein
MLRGETLICDSKLSLSFGAQEILRGAKNLSVRTYLPLASIMVKYGMRASHGRTDIGPPFTYYRI